MCADILIYGMNYSPEFAGVGRYSGDIAEYLAETGSEVVVVTTPAHYPGWQVQPPFRNRRFHFEVRKGVRVFRCPLLLHKEMGGIWRLLAPLSFALTSAPIALWQILAHRPKTVLGVVPTLFGAPVLLIGAWLTGGRTVLHIQDLEVDAAFAVGHLAQKRWLKRLGAAFERFVLRRFNQIITISDRMAEKIVEKGVDRKRIIVIRNWVDLNMIRPLEGESPYRQELGYQASDFIVEYSGNIGRKQGLGVLLDAADLLGGEHRIKFVIAGEGPAKPELVARYARLTNVRFLPFQPSERLSDFLGLADIHALPQDANAADLVLPSKLGGMLASSKPIVAMADPDTELARFLGNSAVLVEPGSPKALADAILSASREQRVDAGRILDRNRLAASLSKGEGLLRFANAVLGPRAVAEL